MPHIEKNLKQTTVSLRLQCTCCMYEDCEDFVTIPRLKLLRFETELACAHITRLAHFPGSNAVLAGTDKGSLQARLILKSH